MDYATLKARHRQERESWPEGPLTLRVHRALSWLDRAEQCDDPDGRFIFLWIAFNAAYAQEVGRLSSENERRRFSAFLGKLVDLDSDKALYGLLWQRYSGTVRVLLDNKYVFQPFWDFQSGNEHAAGWEQRLSKSKAIAGRALGEGSTLTVLNVVMERLYTLRSQLFHGVATWNSSSTAISYATAPPFSANSYRRSSSS